MNILKDAQQKAKDFVSKSGQHTTTVHETMKPAVTHETRIRKDHEQTQQAVDKEVHQDHYHTSVQQVTDNVTLPEQIHTEVKPVAHRSFEHDDAKQVKSRLAEEASHFKDERVDVQAEKTTSAEPILAGEHVHHHVHETIQPVLKKEVIEPHIKHTVVPIHEVHHNASQHHTTSTLPSISLKEFERQGGTLEGRKEIIDDYSGEPREAVVSRLNATGNLASSTNNTTTTSSVTNGTSNLESGVRASPGSTTNTTSSTAKTGSSTVAKSASVPAYERHVPNTTKSSAVPTSNSGYNPSCSPGAPVISAQRPTVTAATPDEMLMGSQHAHRHGSNSSSASGGGFGKRIMDKINPKKDADHDGKKGFMD